MRLLLKICTSFQCNGYFIKFNLLDSGVSQSQIKQLQWLTHATNLASWLLDNYVNQSIEQCPDDLQISFHMNRLIKELFSV
jgi:hypothetical protein